jgi:hypothetical protein
MALTVPTFDCMIVRKLFSLVSARCTRSRARRPPPFLVSSAEVDSIQARILGTQYGGEDRPMEVRCAPRSPCATRWGKWRLAGVWRGVLGGGSGVQEHGWYQTAVGSQASDPKCSPCLRPFLDCSFRAPLDTFNLWLWLELYKPPTPSDLEMLQACSRAFVCLLKGELLLH